MNSEKQGGFRSLQKHGVSKADRLGLENPPSLAKNSGHYTQPPGTARLGAWNTTKAQSNLKEPQTVLVIRNPSSKSRVPSSLVSDAFFQGSIGCGH